MYIFCVRTMFKNEMCRRQLRDADHVCALGRKRTRANERDMHLKRRRSGRQGLLCSCVLERKRESFGFYYYLPIYIYVYVYIFSFKNHESSCVLWKLGQQTSDP